MQLQNQVFFDSLSAGGSLPSVTLTYDGVRTISWTSSASPTTAKVEQSSDGVSWSTYATPSWASGSLQINSDFFYRVTGLNGSSIAVTSVSNLVNVPLNALATSWRTRVQTNGGAAPSTASVRAISDFSYHLDDNGLTSLILSCNVFAPDSLNACFTPLIVGPGLDPWTNVSNQFVSGDLTVNGLIGDGVAKSLATGIDPSTAYSGDNSAGLFVYESTTSAATTCPIGAAASLSTRALELFTNSFGAGIFLWDCWDNTDNRGRTVKNPGPTLAGFYLGTRTGATVSKSYFANSSNPWAEQGNNVGTSIGVHGDVAGSDINVFCQHSGANQFFFSTRRMSAAGVTRGLTSAQGQALYNGIQTLRQTFGGGFV